MQKNEYLMHFFQSIGSELDEKSAVAFVRNLLQNSLLSEREARMIAGINTAIGNNSERADMMRHVLLTIMD